MSAESQPVKVFYSYAHEDRALRDALAAHLSSLRREGLIAEWYDGGLLAGQEWAPAIYQQLATAELILLLISPDFMNSDFCYAVELQQALQRHAAGAARVVPIILRPADWTNAPFSKLQALPQEGKPVTRWSNQDEAFLNIATGIRQLLAAWRSGPRPARPGPGPVPPVRRALRKTYLQLQIAEWRTLPIEALDFNAADPTARRLNLADVYVTLDTTTPRADRDRDAGPEIPAALSEDYLSAVEALCQAPLGRLTLLGQPGSGKTTCARYLALSLGEALLQPRSVDLAQRLPGWTGKARLPVFVPLRLLAADLAAVSVGTVAQVEQFLRAQVDRRPTLAGFGEPLVQELHTTGGLVIFDGLDEVPGGQRRVIQQALGEFAALYPRCRVLVTCRVHSYRQDPNWRLDWAAEHTLADFDGPKIERFIDAWYGALVALNPGGASDYPAKAHALKTALGPADPRGLRELAGTPLLLTVMAIVHAQKPLPDSRVGVYRDCVELLLLRWQGAKAGSIQRLPLLEALGAGVSALKVHQGLREIAYRAHLSGEREGRGSRALVSEVIIRGVLHKRLGPAGLETFLAYCQHANGLLLADQVITDAAGDTEALYVFPHLTFEEYLAALYLLQTKDSGIPEATARAGDLTWWEVVRFLGEYLCHDDQGGNPYLAKALLDALCPAAKPAATDADWRRVWLAGVLLPGWRQEATDRDPAWERRLIDRLAALLPTPTALPQEPVARAAVGRALARVGDPRPGVGLGADGLPDLRWVRIPGTAAVQASGRFPDFSGWRLGTGARPDPEAWGDEKWPISTPPLTIADFELAVYPVTVAQFRPFVEQGGYGEDRYWSETGRQWREAEQRTQPDLWDDPAWTLANHPVVGVTWYEAEAYGHWLNEQWGLPPGTLRLLTEAEWEWAARGPEGRRYPWGDEWANWRCNSLESGLNHTSAVGGFPGGAADWWQALQPESEAAHDLAGNVWGWTASVYTKDYGGAHQSVLNANTGGPRVLRGGSWSDEPRRLRAAYRSWYAPDHRNSNLGFRLARTFPF